MQGKTRIMVEGTIIAALAIVLSMLPTTIGSSFTISLGQIPLTLYALRRGLKPGLMAGFIWGIIHFPMGDVYFLSVPQVLIEYLLAFLFAGFAGIYATKIHQSIREGRKSQTIRILIAASMLGVFARFFWHFVAGWIFWGEYAMWGMSPAVFSLIMNGASGLATGMATSIALIILYRMMPSLFLAEDPLPIQSRT